MSFYSATRAGLLSFINTRSPKQPAGRRPRGLRVEPLEKRVLLDATGLADDLFPVEQNGNAQVLDVLGNDTFMPDYTGQQRITSVSYGSEGGRVEIADHGRLISYAPPADFSSTETFVYYVDNQLSATVVVEIASPLAPDVYQFPPDGETRTLDVLDNDPFWADYDGPRKITLISETLLRGELEIGAGGKSLVYTPPRNVYGKDAFVYIVDDLYPAEVQIEILNPLHPDDYQGIVQKSEANVLDVLANDFFWPAYSGDRTITHVTQPERGGTVTIADDQKTLLYTPDADFTGRDQVRYVVDGVYEATVSLQVHRPVGDDDRYDVDTNSTSYRLNVTSNDIFSFRNGSIHVQRDVIDRVTWVGETAQGGTVEITADGQGVLYSAPAGFEGTDTFEYVADGQHGATVTVQVMRPVRDDTIRERAYEDTLNNVLDVLRNDFKGNGYQGAKIITSVSETSEGAVVTIAADGRSLVYTPPTGYVGHDTFSYTVDGELQAEVRVHVQPIAEDDRIRFEPDPPQTEYRLDVLDDDHFRSNYPGPGLITAVGETENGGLVTIIEGGRSLQFVPAEGGSDEFSYTVDGKYEATVSVRFEIYLGVDFAVVDQNSQENELAPLANDFQSKSGLEYLGPRQITSVEPSEHGGTVTIAADSGTVLYWPAPDFVGEDRFTYTVDGLMQQNVIVHVVRRVRDDLFRVETDSHENALRVLVNDLFGADYSGAGRVTAVTETSAGGTVGVGTDGRSIVYTPPAGLSGEDNFTYTVDGGLKAEVTVRAGGSVEELAPPFGSQADFEQFLLDAALKRYEHLFGQEYTPRWLLDDCDGVSLGGITSSAGNGSGGDTRSHSETNVQVAGVDEGDIIETDGDYLYVLTGNELIIAKAWPADEMSVVSRVTIEGELIAEYLHGDRLAVLSREWEHYSSGPYYPLEPGTYMIDRWWPSPRNSDTWVTVFDVSDRESPTIVQKTKLDGEFVESRRIDDHVFLVLRDDDVNGWLPKPLKLPLPAGAEEATPKSGEGIAFEPVATRVYETHEQYVERVTAGMESFLPQYTSYGADGEVLQTGLLHGPGDVLQPPAENANRLVTVVSLNISSEGPGIGALTGVFTTGASEIYGSMDNLYVFDQQYNSEDGTLTQILKFDWDAENGNVEFAAKSQVPGRMLNQFSADEYQGDLRIATTITNSRSGNWSGRSENVLFVLRDDGGVLEFVGSMQNLALDESIRSVRFMGERAFVTTFRSIDPLFAVDLSDPTHPQSRGYVTIPGFNSYMQLIDEHYLLAVGRNTAAGGNGPTQVSLFDIQDLSRPTLIDRYTFERFSTSEAETDHHAFGWFAQHDVLAMPSARVYWQRVDEDGDGYRETRQSVREDALLLFNIDVTATRQTGNGIELLGELAHDSPVRRSAFIEDVLYSVAENSALAVSIVDPTVRFEEVEFYGEFYVASGPEEPGPIGGTVFEDRDLDGAQDVGEPGLADWSIELTPMASYLRSYNTNPGSVHDGPESAAIEGGRYLLGESGYESGYERNAAYLFDLATGELLQTFQDPEDQGDEASQTAEEEPSRFGSAVAFAGRNVLVSSHHHVYLFDGDTGELLKSFPSGVGAENVRAVSPARYPLVAGSDDLVLIGSPGRGDTRLYDAATGELLQTFAPPEDELDESVDRNTVRHVRLAGDKVLFSVGRRHEDSCVYVYDVQTGARLRTLEVADPAWRGDLLDADGDLAAFKGDKKVFVLDVNTGELVRTFEDPAPDYHTRYEDYENQTGAYVVNTHPVGRSAALVDGEILLGAFSPGSELYLGRVYRFDLETGELLATYKHPEPGPVPSWFSPQTGQTYTEPGPGRFLNAPSVGLVIYEMQDFGGSLVADGQYFLVGGSGSSAAHLYTTSGPQPASGENAAGDHVAGTPEAGVTATTDADGNFQLDGVEPGNYRVHVEPPQSSGSFTSRWSVPADLTLAITGAEGLLELDLGSFLSTGPPPLGEAQNLGTLDFLEIEDVDLSTGDAWYRFQTESGAGDRLLSLVVTGDPSAVIELYDTDGNLLETGAGGRIDWLGDAPPDTVGSYHFSISGDGDAVKLNIVNLLELQAPDAVDQPGRTVKVWGTPDDDLFEFNAQNRTFQYHGMEYDLETELFKSFFNHAYYDWPISVDFGGGSSTEDGHDTARITGTSFASQAIELRPQWGSLTIDPFVYPEGYDVLLADGRGYYHDGLSVTAAGAEAITIDANGGESSAVFQDSPGSDLFVATPTYAGLSGDGFKSEAYGCATVRAHATAGGYDVAKMFDSPGDDVLVAAPEYENLSGEGFDNRAIGFSGVHAYATSGGFDAAKFFDSAADDVFYADPMQACIFESGVYFNRAKHFEAVHAYAVAGGNDVAELYGSDGDDLFYADPVQGVLYRPSVFFNRAKHFEEVYGDGLEGNDQAELHDSALDDLLEGEGSWVRLSNLDLGSLQQATNFAQVEAFSTTGTNRRDIADPLGFVLEYDDTWADV